MNISTFSISQFRKEAAEIADPTVPKEWGRVKTCARRVDVSERTMWQWLGQGLPHARVNGTTLIRFSDLDEWICKHRVERDKIRDIVDSIVRKHRHG
jgi:hypothetical protein